MAEDETNLGLLHCRQILYHLSHQGSLKGKISCLENPRDGGAWWAAVYGVAQSQTALPPPGDLPQPRDLPQPLSAASPTLAGGFFMDLSLACGPRAPGSGSLRSGQF